MARGKKDAPASEEDVSSLSEGEPDSDDSMERRPKKKKARKEAPKPKLGVRKPSPRKKKARADNEEEEEEAGGSKAAESDEDNAQKGLAEEYDDDDLINIKVPPRPEECMQKEGAPRLLITDILVDNFKSYYGRRRIGPFHHNFTSIIGPNGSGKSNVIDALLFVFGYKASKIRSKKVSVLIHSSAGRDDLPSCTVKISFQMVVDKPNGTYDVVPGRGFNVSRTAYKNNSSEYRMNGERISFKEVAAKLREVGIDLIHNRFLILQGEVEQIAMMKPKSVNGSEDGMLEYLEDIIGSSRFKVPIERLSARLEKLQTEKSHQNAKVNAALREKEAMDEPVQTTLQYLTMQNEHTVLSAKQILIKKYNAENSADAMRPDQSRIEEELQKVTTDLGVVVGKLKDKRKEIEAMSEEIGKLTTFVNLKENELQVVYLCEKKREVDMERMAANFKKVQTEHAKAQKKLQDIKDAPIEASAKIEQLNVQLAEHREELQGAQEMFDENFPKYNKKTEEDRAKKVALEEEYSSVAAKLAEAEAQLKLAESSLRSLNEEHEKKRAQLEALEGALAANKEKLERDKATLETGRVHIADEEERLKGVRKEMGEVDDMMEAIKHRQGKLAPLLQAAAEKQQEVNARQSSNKTTQAFEQAVANGGMRGYHGRLGDLGTIDLKYDRAISNNFNLDVYVVENAADVFEGGALLKKIGQRSNFLLNEKQQRLWPQVKQIEAEKGRNTGGPQRLFNLIECEDKYKPAFFMTVRGTYVVEDLTAARTLFAELRAAGRREQIVTLEGFMITAKGGYMGGGAVKEGKLGGAAVVARRQSNAADDAVNAQQAEAAKNEHEGLQARLVQLSHQKRGLEHALNQNAATMNAERNQVAALERQIKHLEDSVRTQEGQRAQRAEEVEKTAVDPAEVQRREAEIEQLKQDRDSAAADSKSFKARIKEVDADMTKIYNKLIKPHEETRDAAREAIEAAEKEMAKQKAVIIGADRAAKRQAGLIGDIEKDMDQKRGKNQLLLEMEETYGKRNTQLTKEKEEAMASKAEKEAALKTLRASTSELDTEEVAALKQQKLLTEELSGLKQHIKGLRKAIKEYDQQLLEIKLTNIAELICDIPKDMQESATSRRFLLDGESESDVDLEEYHAFMTGSPSKKAALKETKKSRKEEKKAAAAAAKKKKANNEDDEEEEGEDEEEEEETEVAEDVEMEEPAEGGDGATGGEEGGAPMEQDREGQEGEGEGEETSQKERERKKKRANETPEEREARRARRTIEKRERRKREEEQIKAGQMPTWTRKHIMKLDLHGLSMTVDDIERKMSVLKKQLVAHVLDDYKIKVKKLQIEGDHLMLVTKRYSDHRDKLEYFKKERLSEFMGGFTSISTALRELYQMITLGGDASLELKDLIDPFLEGVQFMVRPPKKSWKQIENLSGGEKTLSSLALVFALHKYRPTPLYVMDEIDAALDFRNVSIIGHYIKDRTKNAQFIIISLRNNMFELADRLIGIYKVNDCTRNVVVDPKTVLEETKDLRSGLDKVRRLMESNRIHTGVGV